MMLTWCSKSRMLVMVCCRRLCEGINSAPAPLLHHVRSYHTAMPVKRSKGRKETAKVKHFVDYRRVRVFGGNGGDGCLSFLSLPKNEYAGPDGGDGGNGGHVIFQAETNKRDLEHLPSIIRADPGVKGHNKHCHGKNAEHTYIKVPLGTILKDERGKTLVNLEKAGEYFIGARGGAGGKGNHFFLSNEERAPTVAETGANGDECMLGVELRTMAHVGLIGFPNAGKSTLLRAISRARPKVAAYPFTTLNPYVGMIHYDDYEQIAVADIPGLIPGAHQNRGLGFSFLRHIQRCTCLLYVLDLSVEKCWTQLEVLKYELEQFEPGLSTRPHAVIANKTDVRRAEKNLADLRAHIDIPVFAISAMLEENLEPVLLHIRELYDRNAMKEMEERLLAVEEE